MLGDFFVLGCTTGQLVFGPKLNNLRHDVIRECHDIKWADGYRLDISLDRNGLLVATICYQVETNVRTCLVCQQKVENRLSMGTSCSSPCS